MPEGRLQRNPCTQRVTHHIGLSIPRYFIDKGYLHPQLRPRRFLLQLWWEVAILEYLAYLNHAALWQGTPLGPLDSLFLRLHLNDPEAGDHFLCLDERTIRHDSLAPGHLDAHPLGGWVQPLLAE